LLPEGEVRPVEDIAAAASNRSAEHSVTTAHLPAEVPTEDSVKKTPSPQHAEPAETVESAGDPDESIENTQPADAVPADKTDSVVAAHPAVQTRADTDTDTDTDTDVNSEMGNERGAKTGVYRDPETVTAEGSGVSTEQDETIEAIEKSDGSTPAELPPWADLPAPIIEDEPQRMSWRKWMRVIGRV